MSLEVSRNFKFPPFFRQPIQLKTFSATSDVCEEHFFAPGAESVCFDALPRGQAQQLSLARQIEKALI